MYRVGLITDKGKIISKNFDTRDKAETWLLKIMDKKGVKHYKIINRNTKELLETDIKIYKKEK